MLENSDFHFAFIAPYFNLAVMAKLMAEQLGCRLTIIEGAFNEVNEEISRLPEDISVVISRGGTAEKIRSYTLKPVISVETSVLDLLTLLLPHKKTLSSVGLISYQSPLSGVEAIAQALGINIQQFIFNNEEDIESLMYQCEIGELDAIIGGVLVMRSAEKYKRQFYLLETGANSLYNALNEAINIARYEDKSREKAAQLDTILRSIPESLIVTDTNDRIAQINPSALKILSMKYHEVIGMDIHSVIPGVRVRDVLISKKGQIGELMNIKGSTFVVNRIPIVNNEKCMGVVCTLSTSETIRSAEHRLRQSETRRKGFTARYSFEDIKTCNLKLNALKKIAVHYAATEANILIQGQSGTGKELFAQSIHQSSMRKEKPFVAVNCAAIPDNLLESELFGYVAGAFTGAERKGKTGLFELAHGGTLFFDEIGELPLNMQTKLLRVLQEKEIMRLGGNEVLPVDVRIISATNRDLCQLVSERRFRNDLYYRLNTLQLTLPPLSQRSEDIRMLSYLFLQQFNCNIESDDCEKLLNILENYMFHGNIRELQSIIERFSIIYKLFPDVPVQTLLYQHCLHSSERETNNTNYLTCNIPLLDDFKLMTFFCQRHIIKYYLESNMNNQAEAARKLNISKMSIYRYLNHATKDEEKDSLTVPNTDPVDDVE